MESGDFPAIGSIINGKYQVEKIIGEGGVGIVAAARNIELGDLVALKFLRAEMLERADVVGRFVFEAKAACSIKSDHSATVFDVGRTPEGIPFLVMEFLEGFDLASVIEKGPLQIRDVAEYAMHTCEALAAAHAKGIVHRDIKPENLFIELRSGIRSIKVLDFGISKIALTGSVLPTLEPLVTTQNLMGTPLYMSPEQVRSPEKVDGRTDLYSLGVVIYEALTGSLPIMADSITELCAAILEQPITPIDQYRNDLPSELVQVIEKCLAKDMSQRYQNAAEVAIALMPFAPKRARICAERAGEILVAAGIATPSSVRFDSAMPSSMVSSGALPAFKVPAPAAVPISVVPSQGAVSFSSRPHDEPPKRGHKKIYFAAGALVLVLAGGAFAFKHRTAAAEPAHAVEHAPPPVEPLPPAMEIQPPPTGVAVAPAPVPSASASVQTASKPRPKHPRPATSANRTREPDDGAIDIGY